MKCSFPAVIIALSCFITLKVSAQDLDINLLKNINQTGSKFKDKYLELNASSVTALSIGIPSGLALVGFIRKDKLLKKEALYMAGAFISTSLVTQVIKRIVNRKRPFQTYDFIIKRDDESGGLSFPSGHTSAAFCTATSVALRYRQWYYVIPSYIFAISVGWARMYQGLHYPSDVLAGAFIGSGFSWLSYQAEKKWFSPKNKSVKSSPQF